MLIWSDGNRVFAPVTPAINWSTEIVFRSVGPCLAAVSHVCVALWAMPNALGWCKPLIGEMFPRCLARGARMRENL